MNYYSCCFLLLISFSIFANGTPGPCDKNYSGLSQDELLGSLKQIAQESEDQVNLPNIIASSDALDTTQLGNVGKEVFDGLNQRMIGHEDVKYALAQAVQRAETGTNDETMPISSFMLLGLTGTGKSLTAEALHETLGLKPTSFIVVDSGELQHESDISKLTGAPAGFKGHDETPPLISKEKLVIATSEKYNVNVVLIDEIEKASDALRKLLLGVLDKGRLSTGTNDSIDFTRTIIIMTSNLGQAEMHNILSENDQALGFASYKPKVEDIDKKLDEAVENALKKKFSPEFRNRIDKTFVFKEHTIDEANQILNMNLAKVQRKTFFKNSAVRVLYNLNPEARAFILAQGYKSEFGGRSIKRAIKQMIVDPITNLIGSHKLKPGDLINVKVTNGELSFHKAAENVGFAQMESLFEKIYGLSARVSKPTTSQKKVADIIRVKEPKVITLDESKILNHQRRNTVDPDQPRGLNHKQIRVLTKIDKLNDFPKIFELSTRVVEKSQSRFLNDIYMIELINRLPETKKHVVTTQDIFTAMQDAGYPDYHNHQISSQLHIIWKGLSQLSWIHEVHMEKVLELKPTIDKFLASYYLKKEHSQEFIKDLRQFMNDLHAKVVNLPTRK